MYDWYWLSLSILFWLVFLSLTGLIWAPFGAFIVYRIVRGREKRPMRHAFAAAICSVLFILPWVSLIVPSRFRSLAIIIVLACTYALWPTGPLTLLYIYIDVESLPKSETNLLTAILAAMGLAWIAALIWTIQSHVRQVHQCGLLLAYRVIIPSAGLWVSVVVCIMVILANQRIAF